MRIIGFFVFTILIFSSCNSTKNLFVSNAGSADIFIECIINENITSYEIIENNNDKFLKLNINNNLISVLLESNRIIFNNFDMILINNINRNILKEFGYKKISIIDNYIQLVNYIYEEINVYVCTGNGKRLIFNKEYFLNKKNIKDVDLFRTEYSYIIRF